MNKTYTITVARTEFFTRTIEANSPEQAEQRAYETPPEDWKTSHFGDFEHFDTLELKK